MKSLTRVVWSEGMHLAQHHFQAQSRFFEEIAGFAFSSLFFRPYGLTACELDAEALLNGTVALTHARGMMPDGLPFHFPADPTPESREIRTLFSPTHDSHLVLLAIPAYRPGHPNLTGSSNGHQPDTRYSAVELKLVDETTGQDEKPVTIARKNFRLILDIEDQLDMVTLPLARVRRDGSGHFIYDSEYIPPCLHIGASAALGQLVGRVIEMLEAKGDSILAERRASRESVAEFASREVANFWLSHAIHSSLAPLRHYQRAAACHPERLYLELARLAGALSTFSFTSHPRTLPLYDHDHLDQSFNPLERHIREHLEIIMPANAVTIPLRPMAQYFFEGPVADTRCFGKAHWFLGIRSSATQGEIIARVPQVVKVCAGGDSIVKLVQRAWPGLTLEHVPAPPAALNPRIGMQYFRMQQAGPCWDYMTRTSTVGVYVPGSVPDAELQLSVVLES